jgi:hypothetical protein
MWELAIVEAREEAYDNNVAEANSNGRCMKAGGEGRR